MLLLEGSKFAACRIGSGLLETILLFLMADVFAMNGNFWKIIVSVVVIVINYVGSKFLVFTRK
jgi:putative flippase GtrA